MSTIPYTLQFNRMGEWASQQSLFKLRNTYVAYGIRRLRMIRFMKRNDLLAYYKYNHNCCLTKDSTYL